MNKEKDELIPFQADVNTNLFFPGAQRRELLDEVKKAIADGVAVLSIIGDEGTGKTMLCRMVEEELSDGFICVYLPETLESFDEVIRVLASEAGVDDSDQLQSVEEIVSAIIDILKDREQHLVVIFDQAERMYLAMLERLRKLLDRMNSHENLLQLIFSGRKVLLENLDQIAICDFEDAAETHFYLDDLDMSETYAYLNHCARQRSRVKGKSIFTPEASKKIYNIARGSLKTTNLLAAKSIESADSESSFVVAPRNVNIKDTGLVGLHEPLLAGVRRRGGWLLAGAMLLVLSIFLIAYLSGSGDNSRTSLQKPTRPLEIGAGAEQGVETLSSSSSSSADQASIAIQEDEISESSISESPIVFKTEADEKAEQQKNKQLNTVKEEAKSILQTDKAQSTQLQNQSLLDNDLSSRSTLPSTSIEKNVAKPKGKMATASGIDTTELDPEAKLKEPIAAEVTQIKKELQQGKVVDPTETDSQVKLSKLSVKEEVDSSIMPQHEQKSLAVLETPEQIVRQEKKRIVGAGKQQESPTALVGTKKSAPSHLQNNAAPKQLFKVAKVRLPVSGTEPSEKVQQESAILESNFYQQRVAAGKVLFSSKMEETQTIQIMALTGEHAEKNLKARFSRKEYQEIADNLYILENENKSTLFVYYGAFPDKESANRAREQLPPFLGKNEPYVISILEAMSKITP